MNSDRPPRARLAVVAGATGTALLALGCVSVAPGAFSTPTPSLGPALVLPTFDATVPQSLAPTRRPCQAGDTRPRCQTPAPTVAVTPAPTDTPTPPPTDTPPPPPPPPTGSTGGVDTDIAISTLAIDFGQVNVGSTATASITLTNTGGDPFGPINIFGGAPPTAEFDASQNCQGTTLAAGGSCMVNYEFSPGSAGSFVDFSGFTISETNSQSDGEDFNIALSGTGFAP